MKNKNYTVISKDAGKKLLDKIQQSFTKNNNKKKSPESGHRGNIPQHNEGHIQKKTNKQNAVNIILSGENWKHFSSDH